MRETIIRFIRRFDIFIGWCQRDNILDRLFIECRFGFAQALDEWPENYEAKGGLVSAIRLMIEIELKRRNAEAATALLAELKRPPTELVARVEALRDELSAQAKELAEARRPVMAETLRSNLAKVLENTEGADPDRLAQELAMLAVKADVTEELDRLSAHVAAARELLGKGGAVGRKLDFLMQEFNREANTLCSKSQSSDLTALGLELKAVIDQIREQVQNVE